MTTGKLFLSAICAVGLAAPVSLAAQDAAETAVILSGSSGQGKAANSLGNAVRGSVNSAADAIRAEELPDGIAPTSEGWLRTDPSMLEDQGGLDGFFIGRWKADQALASA